MGGTRLTSECVICRQPGSIIPESRLRKSDEQNGSDRGSSSEQNLLDGTQTLGSTNMELGLIGLSPLASTTLAQTEASNYLSEA